MNYLQYLLTGNKLTRAEIIEQLQWLARNGYLDLKGKDPDGYDTRKDGRISDTEKARLAAQAAGWKFNNNGVAYKSYSMVPEPKLEYDDFMQPHIKKSRETNTINAIKQEQRALNNLIESGAIKTNLLTVDGIDTRKDKQKSNTQKARELAEQAGYTYFDGKYSKNIEKTKPNLENVNRLVTNLIVSPKRTIADATLYAADKLGAPSNATNLLRDINASFPSQVLANVMGAVKTLFNDKSFAENRDESYPKTINLFRPLVNTNSNYSEEELANIAKKSKNGTLPITDAAIHKVDGSYGSKGSILDYLTNPDKVVQSSIGRANAANGIVLDEFDTNITDPKAKADNEKYWNKMKEEPGLNYHTLRAFMPYIGSVDAMPDNSKIKTKITFK